MRRSGRTMAGFLVGAALTWAAAGSGEAVAQGLTPDRTAVSCSWLFPPEAFEKEGFDPAGKIRKELMVRLAALPGEGKTRRRWLPAAGITSRPGG